jgi:hypothetical protein
MGFSSRLAVAAWAVGLATTALGLSSGGCAREPGEPEAETRTPVNALDLTPGNCVDTCQPDYGSGPVDCAAAEAGIEFFPAPVWDFENPTATRNCERAPGMPNNEPTVMVTRSTANYAYSYSDNTTEFLRTDDCACEGAACDFNRYQPNTEAIERCGAVTHALHVRGGPFLEWGGGIGRRLLGFATEAAIAVGATQAEQAECSLPSSAPTESPPSFCPRADPRIDNAPGRTLADGSLRDLNRTDYYGMVVDLREWEGISFWARRGPDSQAGFRVALGDRNTDDDIAFLELEGGLTPRCSRIKQCECRQQDKFCVAPNPNFPERTWCLNPATDEIPPPDGMAPQKDWDALNYERCGNWSCDQPYAAFTRADLAFSTSEAENAADQGPNVCAFHAFATDQTGDYCYDPVHGPPPAEGTERCGDTWLHPVALSPDWQFFKVPFAELRQEGWAKRFPRLDVSAVTMVRFTWSVGWVDYWIDDVRFYRRRK